MNINGGSIKEEKILRIALNRNIETIYRKIDFKGHTMSIKTYLSIITLNVKGLNVPPKNGTGLQVG